MKTKKSKRRKAPHNVTLDHNGACYVVTDKQGIPWRVSDYRTAQLLARMESNNVPDAVTISIAATAAMEADRTHEEKPLA